MNKDDLDLLISFLLIAFGCVMWAMGFAEGNSGGK